MIIVFRFSIQNDFTTPYISFVLNVRESVSFVSVCQCFFFFIPFKCTCKATFIQRMCASFRIESENIPSGMLAEVGREYGMGGVSVILQKSSTNGKDLNGIVQVVRRKLHAADSS